MSHRPGFACPADEIAAILDRVEARADVAPSTTERREATARMKASQRTRRETAKASQRAEHDAQNLTLG